eukprot:3058769-Amphidinium_carterae.1
MSSRWTDLVEFLKSDVLPLTAARQQLHFSQAAWERASLPAADRERCCSLTCELLSQGFVLASCILESRISAKSFAAK